MAYELPPLPYAKNALQPHISAETLEYHYDKHHRAYVDKLNELVKGSRFEGQPLEDIIKRSEGPVFNNAAQVWNHTFFWKCMSPNGGGEPKGAALDLIKGSFDTVDNFKQKMSEAGLTQFGSGWAWLAKKADGGLVIEKTANADNPMVRGLKPLLTIDVWEHAYYIDYRNRRADFIKAFWNVVNWDFLVENAKG